VTAEACIFPKRASMALYLPACDGSKPGTPHPWGTGFSFFTARGHVVWPQAGKELAI
jgi:hypothetical protein